LITCWRPGASDSTELGANWLTRGGYDEIMATKLERTIRREILIDGEPYTVAISPDGLRLTKKRFRSGVEMSWKAIWTQGDRRDEPPIEGERG
jgi:hypothetical protein